MKTYQKPIMIALSLTGNEQLCGSCVNPLRPDLDQNGLNEQFDAMFGNQDGEFTKSEFNNLFGNGECDYPLENYCKFSQAGIIVAWS